MLANQSYNERVSGGKEKEKLIVEFLRSKGMTIENPSDNEDMHDKIDGWIVENNTRKSMQVKFREGGDDIIFEIIKDIDRKLDGRDFISKSDYYLVVDRYGNVRLFHTAPIKAYAKKMKDTILPFVNSGNRDWKGHGWNLKITVDKAHGNRKLMAYFAPHLFQTVKSWKMEITW